MKESQTEPHCSPIGPDNKHAAPNGASFRGKKPLLLTQWPLQFMKSVYRYSIVTVYPLQMLGTVAFSGARLFFQTQVPEG